MQVDPRIDYLARAVAVVIVAVWGGLAPMVQLLMALMIIDIATGVLAAAGSGKLSSQVSMKGMSKKAVILCLVLAAFVLEGASRSAGITIALPIGGIVAAFYAAHEGLSIIENAAEAGLPVPQILKDAMSKIEQVGDATDAPPTTSATNSPTVPPAA